MVKLEEMRVSRVSVKNFRSIKNLRLDGLQEFSVLIGQNGVGKSNLMSIFSFLSDCISVGNISTVVEKIGIDHLCHNGNTKSPTEIAITFRDGELNTTQYSIKIVYDNNKVVVADEQLIVSNKANKGAQNYHELHNKRGKCSLGGSVEHINSTDVALSIFGRLPKKYRETSAVYNFLKDVYTINFALTELRSEFQKDSKYISYRGNNLKSVALVMQNSSPKSFARVVEHMRCALDITAIKLQKLPSGDIALSFIQGEKEISEGEISDGMLSLFAYYVLLEQPLKSSMLCIEEPERNISPNSLTQLAEVMRVKAHEGNAQILVTSHSPEFISALQMDEVFYVTMEENNTLVTPLKDNKALESDMPLGELYAIGLIDAAI